MLSTDAGYMVSDGTNAKAEYSTFSILYKYRFLDTKADSAEIGTGVGNYDA